MLGIEFSQYQGTAVAMQQSKEGDDVQVPTALDRVPTELCLLGILVADQGVS